MANTLLVWSSHYSLTKGMSKGMWLDRNAGRHWYVSDTERVK